MNSNEDPDLGIREFQRTIEATYSDKDSSRGVSASFMWLVEEVCELARSLNSDQPNSEAERAEFADVFAWLTSLASLRGVDLASCAREKYQDGCPRCQKMPCCCQHRSEGGA